MDTPTFRKTSQIWLKSFDGNRFFENKYSSTKDITTNLESKQTYTKTSKHNPCKFFETRDHYTLQLYLRHFMKCRCFHKQFLFATFKSCVILGVMETQLVTELIKKSGQFKVVSTSKIQIQKYFEFWKSIYLSKKCWYVIGQP